MNIKIKCCFTILMVFVLSCKKEHKENVVNSSKQNEIVTEERQETKVELSKAEKNSIIEQLEGKWKESGYPYRTAEFVNSTVKFVEEGTEGKPKFEKFEVSANCQFDNNNIKDLKASDIILSLSESKRCEKLKVSNDTLTLSGSRTNSDEDYKIVYVKLK